MVEHALINDVFYALLGLTGDIIIEIEDTFTVRPSFDLINDAVCHQVGTVVRLGWYYKQFKSITEYHNIDWKSRMGLYELALFDGISDLLSDFESEVGYLEENERLYNECTLSFITQHLQKYLSIFPEVYALISDLIEKNIVGCLMLNHLSEYSSGIPAVMSVISRFLNGLRVVFVKQVYSWMLFGELNDDFFVALNTECEKNDASITALSCKNLSVSLAQSVMFNSSTEDVSGYVLVPQRIPVTHISSVLAGKVLFAGKAVKLMFLDVKVSDVISDSLVYLSGRSAKMMMLMNVEGDDDHNNKKNNTLCNYRTYFEIEMLKIVNELHTLDREPDNAVFLIESLIDKIYISVTEHMWSLLKGKLQFGHYFYAMRNVYLLGKGELFQNIIDQVIVQIEQRRRLQLLNPQEACKKYEILWVALIQSVSKALGIDEDSLGQLLKLKVKEKGSMALLLCKDTLEEEELSLVGSSVMTKDKLILCPSWSSVNFTTPVQSVGNISSTVAASSHLTECYKGGVLFADVKNISHGFSASVVFNLTFNSFTASPLVNFVKDSNLLLGSLCVTLSPTMKELESSLHRNQSAHRFGAVTIGVSFHGIRRSITDKINYQCQVFLAAGDVHRVTSIDIDESFLFLGSSLIRDKFVLEIDYVCSKASSVKHPHLMKIRMVPSVEQSQYKNWSLEIPIDISKVLIGGNAFLGIYGLSAQSNSVTSNAKVSVNVFELCWKSIDPTVYVLCSEYTVAEFPNTAKELKAEVTNINRYLCLDCQLKLPTVYQIVYDGEMIGCYRKVFSFLMKVRLIASLMEKLLIDHPSFVLDRVFCHLKHSMHFFINNLLYYLQVDVIDSQFSELEESLLSGTAFQNFIQQQKKFLSNVMRMSMLNNMTMIQSINKVLHCCIRFVAVCRLVESHSDSTVHHSQLFVPSEEYQDIRVTFFNEVKSLLLMLRNVENGGFLFRLDFNSYFSTQEFV